MNLCRVPTLGQFLSIISQISTQYVKDSADILVGSITMIINLSLAEGKFLDAITIAHATPLLKKPSLDRNELSNFRPVSVFCFQIDRENRPQPHAKYYSGISNNLQSAYKSGHSAETALLYIQNDILSAQDCGELTALLLLDLSAAFDTFNHDLLLNRLTEWFGIDGVMFQLVGSYLTSRSHRDCYCAVLRKALCWVHFFSPSSMYTTPLSSIITAFGLKHHLYADDTQIYTSFVAENITQSLIVVQNYMLVIQVWMNQDMLKLNPSKSEFMMIGNLLQRKKVAHIFPLKLLNQFFSEICSIRNLDVAFDPAFSFRKHASNICRSTFYHIRDLIRIRIHLNKATAIPLPNALVSSRLDYCNSLLFGCSEKYNTSLQRVQNCLARVVTRSSRLLESRPLLNHCIGCLLNRESNLNCTFLHIKQYSWLPHISVICCVSTNDSKHLRSESTELSHLGPRSKINYCHSSFVVAAPRLWNKLPFEIREAKSVTIFRIKLKTHIFTLDLPP